MRYTNRRILYSTYCFQLLWLPKTQSCSMRFQQNRYKNHENALLVTLNVVKFG